MSVAIIWFCTVLIAAGTLTWLIQRLRDDWIELAEKLWKEIKETRSFCAEASQSEKYILKKTSERICDLETLVAQTLERLQDIEDTPERKSKAAASLAIKELLERS